MAILASRQVHAANGTWNQTAAGTFTWSTAANWLSSAVPDGAGETALVSGILSGSQTINVTAPITLGTLTLGSLNTGTACSITLSGSTIMMDSGGGNVAITKQLNGAGAGRTADFIGNNLVLTGNLLVTNNQVSGNAVLNFNGTITESGGSRSVTASAGSGVALNNTANSYTGKTTVNSGLLNFASIGNIGAGSSSLGNPGNTADGTIALGSGANSVTLRYTGSTADATTDRVLDFAGTNQTVTLQSSGGRKITFTSPFSFSGSSGAKSLVVGQGSEVIISGNIVYGNLSLGVGPIANGSADASLLGLNTFDGTTTLNRGVLTINSIADWNAVGIPSSLGAPTTLASATITLNPNSTGVTNTLRYIGTGHSSNRPIALADANATSTGATIDASGSGKLSLTGGVSNAAAGNKTLNLTGTGEGELGGVINNFDSTRITSLAKAGTGAWTLSGANTYTGTTTIGAGSLIFQNRASLYGGVTASWTQANINTTANGAATLGLGVGGTAGFTNADVTTLIGALGTGAVSTGGMRATSSWGFDTTNTGSTFTVADPIADTTTGGGAIGVTKLGSGTLSLTGTNTFTRGVRIQGGVLTIGNATALGSGTGYLQIAGGTLDLGGFDVNRGAGITAAAGGLANGVISGTGGLTKTGTGTFRIDATGNSFTGATAIQNGVVEVAAIAGPGAASSLGAPLLASSTIALGNATTSGTFRYIGTTSATMSRIFNLAGSSGGGAIENNSGDALVISSPVTATGAGTKTLVLGGASTAANTIGAIQQNSDGNRTNVVKDGPGLWRILASSTYTGSFTVRNGTLVAAADSTSTNGAFGASSVTDVFVGDSSPTATGTAALLLAAGFNTTKVMNVQGGGGSQVVVLGGEGGVVDFQNNINMGRGVTLVAGAGGTTSFSGFWYGTGGVGSSPVGNVAIGSVGNTGMVRVLRNLAPSGSVGVRFGTLSLGESGTIAGSGPLTIDTGATLAGSGLVTGTLGGAGSVAPGNSAGILTAGAVDPTAGLDWAFELTGTAPTYSNALASVNDVLRLTGTASPFTTLLSSSNAINVYLDVGTLSEGNTFRGGFFTNLAGDFGSRIADATYTYWVSGTGAGQTTYENKTYVPFSNQYSTLQMAVTTVSDTATFFGESPTSGQVMQFTVVVPEPGTLALAALGLGLAGWTIRRRRAA